MFPLLLYLILGIIELDRKYPQLLGNFKALRNVLLTNGLFFVIMRLGRPCPAPSEEGTETIYLIALMTLANRLEFQSLYLPQPLDPLAKGQRFLR